MDAYAISARATTIPLDEGGRGVASLTVANQTGRSVRARASVSPFEPASSEWFAIDGASERLMPPSASEEFVVRVTAPVGGETGPRSFRLDVASVDRPDDEWAHGPTVSFELMRGGGASEPGYIETATGVAGFTVQESVGDDGKARPFYVRVIVPPDAAQFRPLIERVIATEKPAYVQCKAIFPGDAPS